MLENSRAEYRDFYGSIRISYVDDKADDILILRDRWKIQAKEESIQGAWNLLGAIAILCTVFLALFAAVSLLIRFLGWK